jgi:ankyrin repeat protein
MKIREDARMISAVNRKRLQAVVILAAVCLSVTAIIVFCFSRSRLGTQELAIAARDGNSFCVWTCLRLGVNPNKPMRWGWHFRNLGHTPLTAAAQHGHVDIVRDLLQHGADPNLRDSGSEYPHDTPLSTGAKSGELEVCRVLLEAGADPNVPTNPGPGAFGNWTALDWALQAKQPAVANLLRQHGGRESGRRIGE